MARRAPDPPQERAFPWRSPPPDWRDSPAEWAIFWAHRRLLGEPGLGIWDFQPLPFGSRRATGFIPDFLDYDVRVSINVRNVGGEARVEARERANEVLRAAIMAAYGYRHITIDGDHALAQPVFYLEEARAGVSHSRG